ncbi:MAG: universal stress protein [Elainella sp. Prado103]|jgi:nucleotide-binding universal stress UspA family protein|nr:universal stress protein [Elainella sp. Prado103]
MHWLPKQYVLVPIDFSDASFLALAPAQEVVAEGGSLHILYVLPPLSPVDPAARWHTITDKSREEHVREALQAKLLELGYSEVQIEVTVGNPAREIVRYAETKPVDLIVMPTHDEQGVSHFLFGSTTEQVARHAPCSVLIVR